MALTGVGIVAKRKRHLVFEEQVSSSSCFHLGRNHASTSNTRDASGKLPDLDFSLPLRPFIKRYASGASGPKKFAILVARMSNGDLKSEVAFSEIERQWNKMKPLMGGPFNGAHATRAKDHGWVDSPKHGVYKLLGDWRGALPVG